MKNLSVRKITTCAVLSSLALISFMLENLLPPLILPGARLGLSNIFILLSAIVLGWGYGYATLLVKVTLGSIFAGNFSAILYSLPAGLLSLSLELVLILVIKRFSLVATSIAGATLNITVQNLVFCLIPGYQEYLSYLPYLSIIGIGSGLVVGLVTHLIIKKINFSFLNKEITKTQENNTFPIKRNLPTINQL